MPVIDAQSVSKQFLLKHNASVELKVRFLGLLHPDRRQSIEEFWALRDVSLRIDHGEAVGLVGRNGSGKSTLLKLIAAIHRPTSGRLLVARGARISSMIELGVGFHPELTGRENVVLNASIHGLTRAEIDRIYGAVVAYSGLEHFIDVPLKNYSSGMHMRLGFAIAANLDPDILLLDEIFAVGDADFQQRCIATVKRFMDEGKTLIFVSHAPSSIRAICRRVCVLEQGELAFDGGLEEGLAFYEWLLARRSHGDGSTAPAAQPASAGDDEADLDRAPHRTARGGLWRDTGRWQFEFLRQQGLGPRQYVLDVGCGSLSAGLHLLPFLDENHYWGFERDRGLLEAGVWIELPRAGVVPERGHFVINDTFELDAIPDTFDFA
ncbi:MAG TPA: ABC transporter ATP-binding protein, partial [Vicinamibacterales bacterium]|nr:ABC transporter ATP-binding protein [Vicinamibacterales bacterium]